jgi:hypothetical protein
VENPCEQPLAGTRLAPDQNRRGRPGAVQSGQPPDVRAQGADRGRFTDQPIDRVHVRVPDMAMDG